MNNQTPASSKTESTQTSSGSIPLEASRWNWGAFLLNWIWGIGNNVWIALLALIPIFNIVWIFILGAKGSQWAWQKGRFDNLEHFQRVQRNWAIAGFIVWGVMIALLVGFFVIVSYTINNFPAVKQAVTYINKNQRATQLLGSPIKRSGMVQGGFRVKNGYGLSHVKFKVKGPKGEGILYVKSIKQSGPWVVTLMLLDAKGEKVVISNPSRSQQSMPQHQQQFRQQHRNDDDSRIHPHR